jgi:hypothetical protein
VIYQPVERGDFVARVEFRLTPGSESGLLIRYPGTGDYSLYSMCEIQILDDSHPSYAGIDARCFCGSAWGMAAAKRGYVRPPREWNVQEVTVRGSTVKVELNGAVILDTDLATIRDFEKGRLHPGKDRTSGYFGLQSGLGTNQGNVDFRKIEIRDLPRLGSVSPTESRPAMPLATGSEFRPLFNGKDLTGWKVDRGESNVWRVEDGHLVAHASGDYRKQAFLLSEKSYSDFVLRFEFWLPQRTDSGIAIRAEPGERPSPLEVNLRNFLDDPPGTHAQTGAFRWSNSGRGGDYLPPVRSNLLRPSSTWNDMAIEARGRSVRVMLNGQILQDLDLDKLSGRPNALPSLKRRFGRVGFQSHTGTVRFRNIEIKELNGAGGTGGSPANVAESPSQAHVSEPPGSSVADPLQPGSVWVTEPGNNTFTVLERQGERFKSLFVIGSQIREVSGTIKDGRLRWLGRDVKAIAGSPGAITRGRSRATRSR